MSDESRPIPVQNRPTPQGDPGGSSMLPSPVRSPLVPRLSLQNQRIPLIDIHETPEGLVLEADVPGASEHTLTIHLEHNVLSLRAGVEPPDVEGARLIQQEYPLGDYERSFILSDEVDRATISAELKNGVLRISLPRAERARTRRIDVRSE